MHGPSRTLHAHRSRPARVGRAAGTVAVALVLLAVVPAGSAAQEDPAGDGSGGTTTTTAAGGRTQPVTQPTGQVAYVRADGSVWVGNGDDPPTSVGEGAALGFANQAAVALSPAGDVVAWVRGDGSLVIAPVGGGDPTVLATDVALDWLGREPIIAWNGPGDVLAYVAVGTQEHVQPRGTAPRGLNDPEAFPVPLPAGVLGNRVRTVSVEGVALDGIGDPSQRSFIGVDVSLIDPLMVLESVVPGTTERYTLVAVAGEETEELVTPISADDPDFAPDGSFVVAVGPSKGRQELVRIALDDFGETVLAVDDRICNPVVSPDATRIVYGAGENCQRVMLISSKGGQAFDVTPFDTPDTASFGAGEPGWTADGRFLTLPDCRTVAGAPTCNGDVAFLEPDSGRVLPGPEATTVSPIRRPLVQDLWVDVDLRGPFEFRGSFPVDETVQGRFAEMGEGPGSLEATLKEGSQSMSIRLTAGDGPFVTGTLTAADPETGVDRSFLVLGRVQLLGARIVSIAGVWYATDDLPFATGEFDIAVRRR